MLTELILLPLILLLSTTLDIFSSDDDDKDTPPPSDPDPDPGPTKINGSDGRDTISGTAGDDILNLLGGSDLTHSAFEDLEYGGDDTVRGGDGSDLVYDNSGSNILRGGNGDDAVIGLDAGGEPGADILSGGFGVDLLVGDDGDTMTGGASDDAFIVHVDDLTNDPVTITDFDPSDDGDVDGLAISLAPGLLDGQPASASDLSQSFNAATNTTTVSLGDVPVVLLEGVTSVNLNNITVAELDRDLEEEFFGPIFLTGDDDTFVANGFGLEIFALNGDDTIFGSPLNDNISLGQGDDTYISYDEFDEGGNDTVSGSTGDDLIIDTLGADTLSGGFGSDIIRSAAGYLTEEGGPGFDAAPDVVDGGGQADTLIIDNGDTATGGSGNDVFIIRPTVEQEPVTITDFEAGGDSIAVIDTFTADARSTLSTQTDGDDVLIVLRNADLTEDIVIARVLDTTAAQLGDIDFIVEGTEPGGS